MPGRLGPVDHPPPAGSPVLWQGSRKGRPMANCERSGVGLKRLRYFVAVCDHGGFSRAATVLGMAQPALTRQIQILEQEVGLSLLIRTGRGAEPTEQGRYL